MTIHAHITGFVRQLPTLFRDAVTDGLDTGHHLVSSHTLYARPDSSTEQPTVFDQQHMVSGMLPFAHHSVMWSPMEWILIVVLSHLFSSLVPELTLTQFYSLSSNLPTVSMIFPFALTSLFVEPDLHERHSTKRVSQGDPGGKAKGPSSLDILLIRTI